MALFPMVTGGGTTKELLSARKAWDPYYNNMVDFVAGTTKVISGKQLWLILNITESTSISFTNSGRVNNRYAFKGDTVYNFGGGTNTLDITDYDYIVLSSGDSSETYRITIN